MSEARRRASARCRAERKGYDRACELGSRGEGRAFQSTAKIQTTAGRKNLNGAEKLFKKAKTPVCLGRALNRQTPQNRPISQIKQAYLGGCDKRGTLVYYKSKKLLSFYV